MIHFDAPIPGAASDTTGTLSFVIQPVPEPSSAVGLLAVGLLLSRRLRHPR